MESSDSTKQDISRFIAISNEIETLNTKLKAMREERNTVEKKLLDYTESNNIKNISIKTDSGNFKFCKVKQSQPLTFKYLEQCLNRVISHDDEVTKMMNFIKHSRETTESMVLKKVKS